MTPRLELPDSLTQQLRDFRRRVWWIKLLEALAGVVIGILAGFMAVYLLDRLYDTPAVVRTIVFSAAVLTMLAIPVAIDRWIIRRRRLDQLARLLAETHPSVGDQLLGVIELSADTTEQRRSYELVQAAINQVALDVGGHDLSLAVPKPRHRRRGMIAFGLVALAGLLAVVTLDATQNAWARFLQPWSNIQRYTFASVDPLPDQLIVAHGEPFSVTVPLKPGSRWKPAEATVYFPGQREREATLASDEYEFELPGQIKRRQLAVRVGDYRSQVPIVPMLRPELTEIDAEIELPRYLGRDEHLRRTIRAARVSVVRGSSATIHAKATRNLKLASINGEPATTDSDQISTDSIPVNQNQAIELNWEDEFGLQGKEPLELYIEAIDDEAPTVVCENLPRRKVLLDSEVLKFQVRARDDFGVKRVGIEWKSIDESGVNSERLIAAGHSEAESLDLAATFCARDEEIKTAQISLRVFVEDYLPGRERSYGPECFFQILDPADHAIWVTSQLRRWHRMSLDVRDREMRLHETNKQLRQMTSEQLTQEDVRERLAEQADQERANGRQLEGLVRSGESLLAEAMRNDKMGVGHLQNWAEMMQVLKDISENRMPSVADLLKQASKNGSGENSDDSNRPSAGQNRLTQSVEGKPGEEAPENKQANSNVPAVSDVESTQNQFTEEDLEQKPGQSSGGKPRLSLTQTQLAGNGKQDASSQPLPESGPLEEAVNEQRDLLAEFEKVAGDLNDVLANMEGSTLVKRLKASARNQQQIAGQLAGLVTDSFGVSEREKEADAKTFSELADREANSSQLASNIMDDMSAYFDRSRYMLFKRVLDDMRKQDVTAGLRALGEELRQENGLAISQAEYWSDTFDRWAEDLVEVTQSGACPGAKSKDSLPPSIVLEVLQLLESEVNLREQTRVAEQARPAVSDTEHMEVATKLSLSQNDFHSQMDKVIARILDLPEAQANFSDEINLLSQVSDVMSETTEILAKPETGPPAIAAETEIIELLLKSKRFNPQASGGGGSNPGGGGQGDTETPALALVGAGINAKEVREEMSASQSTGSTGMNLPEEFRHGLDQYFNQLEEWTKP
ncbi:MAG: hypothetical protein AAGG48_15445 [Planctomycetota bacterium]